MLFIIVVLWRLKSVERYFVAFKDRFLLLCLAGFTWNCDWPAQSTYSTAMCTLVRGRHHFIDNVNPCTGARVRRLR